MFGLIQRASSKIYTPDTKQQTTPQGIDARAEKQTQPGEILSLLGDGNDGAIAALLPKVESPANKKAKKTDTNTIAPTTFVPEE